MVFHYKHDLRDHGDGFEDKRQVVEKIKMEGEQMDYTGEDEHVFERESVFVQIVVVVLNTQRDT